MSLYVGLFTGLSAIRRFEPDGAAEPMSGGVAEVEDVDVVAAIMDLQVEEVAYQTTLRAAGRPLPETLVSFLR